jgi:hypothetical protein
MPPGIRISITLPGTNIPGIFILKEISMDYRATLNLPQTAFNMKANLTQREPMLLKRWEKEDLYAQIQERSENKPLYVLHDGPPYANGHIHLGTAFNKILKDIILKSKRMAGFKRPISPAGIATVCRLSTMSTWNSERRKRPFPFCPSAVPAVNTRRNGSRPRRRSSSVSACSVTGISPILPWIFPTRRQ